MRAVMTVVVAPGGDQMARIEQGREQGIRQQEHRFRRQLAPLCSGQILLHLGSRPLDHITITPRSLFMIYEPGLNPATVDRPFGRPACIVR